MELTTSINGQVTVVTIKGDLDGNSAPRAMEEIMVWVKPECRILLEMSLVGFMSSIGLRTMLNLKRQTAGVNGEFILVGVSQEIQDTMSVTGFSDFIKVFNNLETGMAFLNQKEGYGAD